MGCVRYILYLLDINFRVLDVPGCFPTNILYSHVLYICSINVISENSDNNGKLAANDTLKEGLFTEAAHEKRTKTRCA